jgi:HEAT repeat protein
LIYDEFCPGRPTAAAARPLGRRASGRALGDTWREESVAPLGQTLLSDQDPLAPSSPPRPRGRRGASAADALGAIGSEAAVPALTTALLDPDEWVQNGAALALAYLTSH